MELIKVNSSMIYAFGYDEQQQVLEVVFKRTGVYRYHNVPKEVYRTAAGFQTQREATCAI